MSETNEGHKPRPFQKNERPGGTNVHIYPSPLTHESRMLKITESIERAEIFDSIVLVGASQQGLSSRERLSVRRGILRAGREEALQPRGWRKALALLAWSSDVVWQLRKERLTCINAHSLSVLPLCVFLKYQHRAKLVYDTHELETETAGARGIRRLGVKLVERLLIHCCDEVSAVNEAIAKWYQKRYRLGNVHVIRNVPSVKTGHVERRTGVLRTRLGISRGDLVFLYQGILASGRGLWSLIDAFRDQPPGKHLVLMGYGPLSTEIEKAIAGEQNIHLHPAVPPAALSKVTQDADVGLSLIENVSLSYYLCLPNKLFEYLHAGLPVIASDLPCIRDVILAEKCGWLVQPDPAQLRRLVETLTREDVERVGRASVHAKERYRWENEEERLFALYQALFRRGGLQAGAVTRAGGVAP